jgi:bla regulator protein blaR1
MGRFVVEFAVRSTLIAIAAGGSVQVLRIRTSAAKHAVWTGVLVAMLALPNWIAWGSKVALPLLPPRHQSAALMTANRASSVAPVSTSPLTMTIPGQASAGNWNAVRSWNAVWIGTYLLGAGALLLRLAIGTFRANRLTSFSCVAPITVGLLRPRVILPDCWSKWRTAQLDAVLIHEYAHARRHDPLIQWLALFNRALFWFHPLAWWLELRLTELAEEVCDSAVLDQGHDPRDYAYILLDLARSVQRAGTRVNAIGMAMPGSHLPKRINKIISGVSAPRVSPVRMASAALVCATFSALFATGTLEHAASIRLSPVPPLDMQAPSPEVIRAPAESVRKRGRSVLAQTTTPQQPVIAHSASVGTPRFDEVSIKPCDGGDDAGEGSGVTEPRRLNLNCQTVEAFIRDAYLIFANGHTPDPFNRLPVSGGPAWIATERYTVEAKVQGTPTLEMMRGPMLQALLEDRFKLKIHRDIREIPVYALTVANSGLKMRPFREGNCIPRGLQKALMGPPSSPDITYCRSRATIRGSVVIVDVQGMSLDEFSRVYIDRLDRPVVNKTGLSGRFDFDLEYSPFPTLGSGGEPGPSIVTAMEEQLGLKLIPDIGSHEFLRIESIERPTGNLGL